MIFYQGVGCTPSTPNHTGAEYFFNHSRRKYYNIHYTAAVHGSYVWYITILYSRWATWFDRKIGLNIIILFVTAAGVIVEKKTNLKNYINILTSGLVTTHNNKDTLRLFPIESRVLITRLFSFIIIYKTRCRYKIYYYNIVLCSSYNVVISDLVCRDHL